MQKTNFWCVVMMIVSTVTYATIIDVPGDYSTIQAGLNAATQGDTVLVQPGTYVENIVWPPVNGIKLFSAGDSSNSVIDGNNTGRIISVTSTGNIDTSTVIQGFRITHGSSIQSGGGIDCQNSSVTIRSCAIISNSANLYGGGIACRDQSNSEVINCYISGNSAITCGGGGIACLSSNPNIINCIIIGNQSLGEHEGGGGGGICFFYCNPILTDVILIGNSAIYGGSIYICSSSPNLTDVTISGNTANYGGGICCFDCGSEGPILIDVTVTENTAYDGGGIWCYWSSPTLLRVRVTRNTASNMAGGIALCFHSNPSIEHCTIAENHDTLDGDGIFTIDNCLPTISYCNIFSNGIGLHNWFISPIVNCPNNWWGDASGPYNPNYNPSGHGDSTNIYVNPLPFLTEPDSLAPPAGISEHHFQPPTTFKLFPNYPNPFNATTTIAFELSVISKVTLKIYNILGQTVATTINGQMMSSGRHEVTFSDTNLSSGVYFYHLSAGRNTAVGKMVLLK